ncbi:Signal transduction histidine kinase [Desulfofundulus australicus DSM 11792]|uniref:histidine kinase n=1 Tax=Desulfofundulus australicus DSM 11792 TaxID=1121425 RepID=A0A1M4X2K7_9FIRM|nr:ATP-binding protein [Desulfofundulus australicus]SHE87719.1 Signal transduction histidine kinase [Desulfofundulus australicus DSM 11792]
MVSFRPRSFRLQVISIVAVLLIVPVLVMIYDILFASRTDDQLIRDMQHRLGALGDHLGEQLEACVLEKSRDNPRIDLTGYVVDEFNRLTVPLVRSHPGIRCGLYITGQERIWVQGFLHEYRPRQPETPEKRMERIFKEAEEGINAVLAGGQPITRVGQTWDDQFLEYLVPVRVQGKVVAVVWVEERLHPLFARSARARLLLRYATLGIFSFAVVATLASLLSLIRGVDRLKKGVRELEKNLAARVPEMPGELGEIGRTINHMAASLEEKEQLVEHLRRSEHLAALGRLVADIAHELRAPIGIMQSTVEVIKPSLVKNEEMKEPLSIIEEQISRLHGLVGELLNFGRPGSGMRELNLNDLISEVTASSNTYFLQNGVELNLSLAEGLPPVKGNGDKLQQVFLNLIVNAVQAMPGGGRLDIETFTSYDGVCAVFKDTGEGIPPEDLDHIFQPFFSRKAKGSGLGLAISQEIVRIHGGTIRVDSRPGQGTAFTVCLPVKSNGEKEG